MRHPGAAFFCPAGQWRTGKFALLAAAFCIFARQIFKK
jgi:hypothetical protein